MQNQALFIWREYSTAKSLSTVIRSGYGLYGVYPYVHDGFDYTRSESDLEHSAGVQAILSGIARYYPDIIPARDLAQYLELARLHDIGEAKIGDIPDNGSRDTTAKDNSEKEAFWEFTMNFPEPYKTDYRAFFLEFQTKSSRRGQIMYLADKIEAILQGLIYETQGRYGVLSNYPKELKPSERDKQFAAAVGCDNLVDMWSFGLKSSFAEFGEIAEPFYGLLYAAVMDVRNEWFSWWPLDT